MKKTLLLFSALTLLLFNQILAQSSRAPLPNFQIGIKTGNHITLPPAGSGELFKSSPLLRYSAGILFRKVIRQMKPKRRIGFGTARKGIIALDLGLNSVFSGYNYSFGKVKATTEQLTGEVSLMIVVYDRMNIFVPRKWWRKGITSYGRFGPKASYLPVKRIEKTIVDKNESVFEETNFGGWNFMWSLNAGILQNHKSGNTTSIEIGWNQGFLNTTNGTLTYSNSTNSRDTEFHNRGSYLSINVIFLYNLKNRKYLPIGKGELPKIINNPRFFD